MIVELSVMEQHYQAVSLVIHDGDLLWRWREGLGCRVRRFMLLGAATVAAPAEG